ncbi:hypothetical protein PBY51_023191 [Eleginops maclovinus]|uniref:TATA box-binding protein-associated factor RNA polymerase I subunit C n=3 Tax=Eleginops maclovinus TaxID=56733 RepID=A0AAN8AE30_ELEMC|nr:hypothetical protein PBY51_023191 [Eleginops maclovinus]
MDYQFPKQLFPSFYNCGPPDLVLKHCAGNWGCYDRVRPQGGSGPLSSWTFTSRHQVGGEAWRHTEPVPVPLLSPKNSFPWLSTPPDPQDFTEHMQNFFMDHCQDAFGSISGILSENLNLKPGRKGKSRSDSVYMTKMENIIKKVKLKRCPFSFDSTVLDRYGTLLSDVLPAVPPELLGSLLYEELEEQRERMLFCEAATGGALAFIPFSQSGSDPQRGCLLYPGNQGLDFLNFHRVELQQHRGTPSCLDASSCELSTFQLQGPVRQISAASLINDCCVAVRSDHLCGVWRFSEGNKPQLMEVVNTKEVGTCISVSPHVLGEVLVASESGAVNLWTVGKRMQKVRKEEEYLYFNAKSSWRWCEFSAHPRVMQYADRTGVELCDIRMSPVSNHTLFRIGNTSECRSGERLILSRYLADVHPFHHLITTQYSAYIMDERFPCMPVLKWDHMMQSPPMFCHTVPGSDPSRTAKVLLGSHSSQEITLLQYSGGRAEACSSRGPPQALLRPRDSLRHLPVQIPHRLELATSRLSIPAAGLTCIHKRGGGGEECICILQLTEAGDIFYQILEPEQPHTPPQAPERNTPSGIKVAERPPHSLNLTSATSSDEDIIGPNQVLSYVPETPERERPELEIYSSSSESESQSKTRYMKRLHMQLQVIDNVNVDHGNESDTAGVSAETVSEEKAEIPEESSRMEEPSSSVQKLSDGVVVTWKQWLQKLMQKSRENKPRPQRRQPYKVPTEDLLHLSGVQARGEDSAEKERMENLRRDLRACMTSRSLLVHSAVSASLGDQEVVAVPNAVDTDTWKDPTSERFTVSWQGEGAWQAWWEENLGLNRGKKVEALRRKRKREKEARRSSSQQSVLSGSFTSSLCYQSDLSDFSNLSGWSSTASQGVWSDSGGALSQAEDSIENGSRRATTPSSVQTDAPVPTLTPTPTPTPQRDKQASQTPSSTRAPPPTPKSLKKSKRQTDYLSALFAPQDEPSQHGGYFLEEDSTVHHKPPPVASSSYQLHSSQSASLRSVRTGFSQSLTPSRSLTPSQSSQGRPGLSQTSQTKKKKPRMGF